MIGVIKCIIQLNHVIEMAVNFKESKNNGLKINPSSFYKTSYPAKATGNNSSVNVVNNEVNKNLIYNSNGFFNQPYMSPVKKNKINLVDHNNDVNPQALTDGNRGLVRRSKVCDAGNMSKYLDS